MKKAQYQKLKKFCKLLENKELYPLINDIINEYEVTDLTQTTNQNEIVLLCHSGEKISLEIVENKLIFTKHLGNTMIQKDILFPNTHTIQSITIEKRPLGLIITKIDKKYNFSIYDLSEKTVTNLESVTSIYKNITLQQIIPQINDKDKDIHYLFTKLIGTNNQIIHLGNHIDFLGVAPDMTTHLEIHMNLLLGLDIYLTTNQQHGADSKLNREDISQIYKLIDGKDKISRIYDLYNGIINERNKHDIQAIHLGLLSSDSYDLKTQKGISTQIDQLVGSSITKKPKSYYEYLKNFLENNFYAPCNDLDSREELLNSINETRTLLKSSKQNQEENSKENTNVKELINTKEKENHPKINPKRLIKKLFVPFQKKET